MKNKASFTKIAGFILIFSVIQYFIVTAIVASVWNPPFNWKENYTSSLGNTACGISEGLYVCSPLHSLMNASFIFQGIVMFICGLLFLVLLRTNMRTVLGFISIMIAGIGAMLLGAFPENVNLPIHNIGATTGFLFSIVALYFIAFSSLLYKSLKWIVLSLTSVSFIALVLFSSEIYLGLGLGGMERLMDYSQALAYIFLGIGLLRLKNKN